MHSLISLEWSVQTSNSTAPPVLDLEDSGGAEAVRHPAVGHGAKGRATHVKVRRPGEADPTGAGVGDSNSHWPPGAGFVAGALDLRIRTAVQTTLVSVVKKTNVRTHYTPLNASQVTSTNLIACAAAIAVLEKGRTAGGDHRRERALADGALITARTACMHRDHQHSVAGLILFNMISSSPVLLRFTALHIDQCDTYRRCRRRKGSRTTSRRRSTIGRRLWLALRCTGW